MHLNLADFFAQHLGVVFSQPQAHRNDESVGRIAVLEERLPVSEIVFEAPKDGLNNGGSFEVFPATLFAA